MSWGLEYFQEMKTNGSNSGCMSPNGINALFSYISVVKHPLQNNKKYVIEVQDHQQAIKAANPIVDLEDTVRRGISDPLADPRFVMNKINDDFFGIPITENSFHNRELMSYQGKEHLSPSILGIASHGLNNLQRPNNFIQQHVEKQEIVARHPSSVAMYQDIGLPRLSAHHNSPLPTSQLSDMDRQDISSNIGQNVAGGLTQGLPGGVAAFVQQKGRLPHIASGTPLGRFTPQGLRTERPNIRGIHDSINKFRLNPTKFLNQQHQNNLNKRQDDLTQLTNNINPFTFNKRPENFAQTINNISPFSLNKRPENYAQQINNISPFTLNKRPENFAKPTNSISPFTFNKRPENFAQTINNISPFSLNKRPENFAQTASNINPLTGLPEDLEDRTYGAVSSITSISDTAPPTLPSSVTVNTADGTSSAADGHTADGTSASELNSAPISAQKNPVSHETAAETSPETASEQAAPGSSLIDDNFSSLKSYLEADDILRDKLSKDGIESVEPSKKTVNIGPGFNIQDGGIDKSMSSRRTLSFRQLSKGKH